MSTIERTITQGDSPHIVIVGGGITGLTAAHRLSREWRARGQAGRITVLEQDNRLGGKLWTIREAGYLLEAGPEGYVGRKPAAAQLIAELGLQDEIQAPTATLAGTYLWKNGRLLQLPAALSGFSGIKPDWLVRSGLLSPAGIVRLFAEPLVPPKQNDDDESLRRFLIRRFGKDAALNLFEPLFAGIAGGSAETLSLAATYPELRELERRYGSVIKGSLAMAKAAKESGKEREAGGMTLRAPLAGMDRIIERIVERLRADERVTIRTGAKVTALTPRDGGYDLSLDGETLRADTVILTAPAYAAAGLVTPFDPYLGQALSQVRFKSISTVGLGYRKEDVTLPPNGGGFVRFGAGTGEVTACTWESVRWQNRAPNAGHLLRCFVSEPSGPLTRSAEELVRLSRATLREVLGVTVEPQYTHVTRWENGLPRSSFGHRERIRIIREAAKKHEALILAGASYVGAGVTDCIQSGMDAAAQALERQPVAA